MKQIFTVLFLWIFLTSCTSQTLTQTPGKQEFIVNTQSGQDFSGSMELEKTGKVSSSQDILLTANAAGRVASVLVKSGDSVQAGQPLATLEDNIGNYGINLERASNGVERAKINYDSTQIQLEKQILDTETSLLTLQRSLVTLKKNSEQSLIQAEDSLENSQYVSLDSKSALQLEQLDNSIEKSKLDYENKLIVDVETIEGFKSSLKTSFNSFLITLQDVVNFSDELLWITNINKDKNDKYEDFLWSQDSAQKRQSEVQLIELIDIRDGSKLDDIESLVASGNMTENQIIEVIDFINANYEKTKVHLNSLETTLNNSLVSVWQLWQVEISAFSAQINGYQSALQGNYSGFISFGSSAKSFLRTYKNTQSSLAKSIELQEKDRVIQLKNLQSGELSASVGYEKTVIGIEDSITNLETQIQTAQRNLENAKQSSALTLRSLSNAIREAEISYNAAVKEFNKLSITSPINGTVSEVFLDAGQEVWPGVQLFNILSDNTPEVEIAFSMKEKDMIQEGQEVYIDIGSERITGKIYSLSEVADANLNYKSTIIFASGTNLIGNIVTVKVPVKTEKMLLPVNIITTKWNGIGMLQTLSGSTFSEVRVRLWEVFGEYVEVVSCAQDCETLKIVTNDISNFDENKFVITEK